MKLDLCLAGLKYELFLVGLKLELFLVGLKLELCLVGLKRELRLVGLKLELRLVELKYELFLLRRPTTAKAQSALTPPAKWDRKSARWRARRFQSALAQTQWCPYWP